MSARSWLAAPGAVLLGLSLAVGAAVAPASAAQDDTIYSLVNQARWDSGLAGLNRSAGLDAVAVEWAREMAAGGELVHNPDLASDVPAGWTAAAENIATGHPDGAAMHEGWMNSSGHPDGAAMHEGWMNSSGHRANLLGDFTDIGIAFISAGGTTWGVQVFAKYPGNAGPPRPQAVQQEPDPQPTEIVDPTVKPTLPVLPTSEPTTPSPSPTPTSSGSATSTPPAGDQAEDSMAMVTWIVVLAVVAAVAVVFGLLALSRRSATRRGDDPDAGVSEKVTKR